MSEIEGAPTLSTHSSAYQKIVVPLPLSPIRPPYPSPYLTLGSKCAGVRVGSLGLRFAGGNEDQGRHCGGEEGVRHGWVDTQTCSLAGSAVGGREGGREKGRWKKGVRA